MANDLLDTALGLHAKALSLRAQRAEILSANIANADTPNYKARDINFRATLESALGQGDHGTLRSTQPGHQSAAAAGPGRLELLYRQPHQAALDGNTVDTQREHAEFMDNALRYQASLTFLSGKLKTLLTAIRGE